MFGVSYANPPPSIALVIRAWGRDRGLREGHFSRGRWGVSQTTPPPPRGGVPDHTPPPLPLLPRVLGGQFFDRLVKVKKKFFGALRQNLHTYRVVLSTRKSRKHLGLISFHFP